MAIRTHDRRARVTGTPTDGVATGRGDEPPPGLLRASDLLLAEALASDDAETAGLRADDVLADTGRALSLLGPPDAWPAARHAVVQRYGRVGALVVLGYEERWRRGRAELGARVPGTGPAGDAEVWRRLDALLDGFGRLGAAALERLLAAFDGAAGTGDGAAAAGARRWLHATYAVAARDGTASAHRAYMEALDRVLRHARQRIAS